MAEKANLDLFLFLLSIHHLRYITSPPPQQEYLFFRAKENTMGSDFVVVSIMKSYPYEMTKPDPKV